MRRRPPTVLRSKPRPCTCSGWHFPHRLSSGNAQGKGECWFTKTGAEKYPATDLPGIDIPELD